MVLRFVGCAGCVFVFITEELLRVITRRTFSLVVLSTAGSAVIGGEIEPLALLPCRAAGICFGAVPTGFSVCSKTVASRIVLSTIKQAMTLFLSAFGVG